LTGKIIILQYVKHREYQSTPCIHILTDYPGQASHFLPMGTPFQLPSLQCRGSQGRAFHIPTPWGEHMDRALALQTVTVSLGEGTQYRHAIDHCLTAHVKSSHWGQALH
uniref:Uncharacterized protein n=1 Tax=Paramormyrops kingsleyae TaxID=1676925 RepID=A0A3B3SHP4_9TELE